MQAGTNRIILEILVIFALLGTCHDRVLASRAGVRFGPNASATPPPAFAYTPSERQDFFKGVQGLGGWVQFWVEDDDLPIEARQEEIQKVLEKDNLMKAPRHLARRTVVEAILADKERFLEISEHLAQEPVEGRSTVEGLADLRANIPERGTPEGDSFYEFFEGMQKRLNLNPAARDPEATFDLVRLDLSYVFDGSETGKPALPDPVRWEKTDRHQGMLHLKDPRFGDFGLFRDGKKYTTLCGVNCLANVAMKLRKNRDQRPPSLIHDVVRFAKDFAPRFGFPTDQLRNGGIGVHDLANLGDGWLYEQGLVERVSVLGHDEDGWLFQKNAEDPGTPVQREFFVNRLEDAVEPDRGVILMFETAADRWETPPQTEDDWYEHQYLGHYVVVAGLAGKLQDEQPVLDGNESIEVLINDPQRGEIAAKLVPAPDDHFGRGSYFVEFSGPNGEWDNKSGTVHLVRAMIEIDAQRR